jgi:hypothetical protein
MRLVLPVTLLLALLSAAPAHGAPTPGSPEYIARDNRNIADAYGRQTAPGGQLDNREYLPALVTGNVGVSVGQLVQQAATPTRPALTPGNLFPGWNAGNPLRAGWEGRRGRRRSVAWTNRSGALIRGDVFAPLRRARDPYTGRRLRPPYPAVVITEGSVQGSARMYWWLAEDLAERGYVVLTYDVQGQGTSETFPHQGPVSDLPFCNPFAPPRDIEMFGCPGVPSQQGSNFVHGTTDAISWMRSRPGQPYRGPAAGSAPVVPVNPFWRLIDRRPLSVATAPGRRTRLAIVGHSLGAFAVSYVQGVDKRVSVAVALDKLASTSQFSVPTPRPVVPSLAVQSEYGFTVNPYSLSGGSSLNPSPRLPTEAPEPMRERRTGFEAWRSAGVDSMLIVPRASTHLEYTDIPLALPASRYGQDLTSVYVQAWLDRYLKRSRGADRRLRAASWRYLEPVGSGRWSPVKLRRRDRLSFYYCSAWDMHGTAGRHRTRLDIAKVGCP